MSNYLSAEQVEQLLKPINPSRVSKDGKGFSHVEAYDVRAHLNRIFGFARWSSELTDLQLNFETEAGGKWTVSYRATIALTVYSPQGDRLATYTEAAVGDAKNQPSRGDAHDMAIKTAESQAFKRAAINLGDQFGLGLYNSGSTASAVKDTLVKPVAKLASVTPIGDTDE
jgi:recombination DNA repair RAD52 pathway protein